MGLVDRIKGLWRHETTHVVHGWVGLVDGAAALPDTSPPRSRYVELIVADFGLRFEKDRAAGRSPVFASAVTWRSPSGEDLHISKTLSADDFASIGADDAVVTIHSGVPLTTLLPLGASNVEYTVGLLSAPGTSLFSGVASFLSDIADLTQRTELTAVGAIADKVAGGIDTILGNDEIAGRIGLHGAVLASEPRAGYYVVTSLDAGQFSLEHLAVIEGRLRFSRDGAWGDPSGFDYLLIRVALRGSQPDRWRDLSSVAGPWKTADDKLAHATTAEALTEAGVSFKLAMANARNDPNLAVGDRDLAAEEIRAQWEKGAQQVFGPNRCGASGFADGAEADAMLELALSISETAGTVPEHVLP